MPIHTDVVHGLAGPSRRAVVAQGLTTLAMAAGWGEAVSAAEVTPAQTELTAPALPPLGTVVRLPQAKLLGGGEFRPEQAQQRVTVVYWWASTCPFCALQSPEMQRFWLAHRDQGLQMLALSVDKKPEDAQTYLLKKGYTFPAAWVTPEVRQVLPKPKGLPVTLVLGRDGRVLQAEKGQMFPEDVAQLAQWLA